MSEDRLMELEVKVAYQEHTIAQLDEELRKMMDRVEMLERRLQEVVAEQTALQASPIDEKPPHY
ncbi:MAG: SlyX family protein [Myxococcales bacterium]|nr:SlyX family protein [Myxococcales bacterium]MCB9668828.1 SlyX family protein [Alphaproteobacteria bacterium]MCB9691373.1 SlyX family protein [Alphaproteobacteria bacterium]